DGIEIVCLHREVDSIRGCHAKLFRTICFIAGTVRVEVEFVGYIQRSLAVLNRSHIFMGEIPFAQLGESLDRGRGSKSGKELVEVSFHSVLQRVGTLGILAFALRSAAARAESQKVLFGIFVADA